MGDSRRPAAYNAEALIIPGRSLSADIFRKACVVISPASESTVESFGVQCLVRYGAIPQVARYTAGDIAADRLRRGLSVVITTDRGTELGEVLELVPQTMASGHETAGAVNRVAADDDVASHREQQQLAADSFEDWQQRILDWKLELELMDVERTLDGDRQILYVINERGAETTRLALLAAAGGHGIISVQPVGSDGLIEQAGGGGCGSGSGCGCGS